MYTIKFEERPDYLYALVEGEEDSYAISKQFWSDTVVKSREKGYKKFMLHERIPETTSLEDVYKLVNEFPEYGVMDFKVAFVDELLDQHTINYFGEILAVNLGLNGKVFNEVEKAERWLLSDAQADPERSV